VTPKVLTPTATELKRRRRAVLSDLRRDEAELRVRAARHELSPKEYYALEELDEIDYLLGTDQPTE
jgi:hypothetical protein